MSDKNVTAYDAHVRVSTARAGSLVDAKEPYLRALKEGLLLWIEQIDGALALEAARRDPLTYWITVTIDEHGGWTYSGLDDETDVYGDDDPARLLAMAGAVAESALATKEGPQQIGFWFAVSP